MQARIIEQRQAEQGEGGNHAAPTAAGPKVHRVADDVMLAKLANEGWAEHVTTGPQESE